MKSAESALFAAGLICALSLVTIGQTLVVDVNLTMLGVRVEDEAGQPVLDLTAADFEILEDGQARPLSHFALEEQPAAIGLLVDRSLSIDRVKRQLGPTLTELVSDLNTGDEAFLMSFAGSTKLHVPLTGDHNRILASIGNLKPDAGTRFYDAAIDALDELSRSRQERKALIILTDGADHYSVHTFDQLLRAIEQNHFETYIIGYVGDDSSTSTPAGRRQIRSEFNQLAAAAGGAVYFPSSLSESMRTGRQILESLHHEYKLGFYRSRSLGESGVQVRVRGANRVTVLTDLP